MGADRSAGTNAGAGGVRAVVTGLGVVAPTGIGVEAYWAATLAGANGIRRLTRFDPSSYPSQLAGEVVGYDAAERLPSRLVAQTDRMTQLALTAGGLAVADAGIDPAALPEYGAGVVTAASGGGVEFGQRELEALWSKGRQHVSAYQSFAWFYAVNTGQLSIRHGLRGPSGVIVTEQAGGLDAVGHARRHLRRSPATDYGRSPAMGHSQGLSMVFSGGVDAALSPWGWVAQLATGLISRGGDPARAYRPFAADADGYVPGEGGAILVVESLAAARARGARVYGEIAGYAATLDPAPGSCSGSGGEPGLRRCAELALADAGVLPGQVDAVVADGAGVPSLDEVEAAAIGAIFGPRGVPVTVPKSGTGRLFSGGAALDLAAALLSMRDGVLPPTPGVDRPAAPYQLDLVTRAPRELPVRTVLVLARGYGGFNAAVVVRGM
ncbi:MAG TPA: ketosynthase chain-length factor [Mycobacteriales bacterium]|nr:ketosynthase chain-length factor [Mycobacteriales bacterium]